MLSNGQYLPQVTRRVVAWPKADCNGPGETVWEDKFDHLGRSLGREMVRDNAGREVKLYPAPEGFRNLPNSERKDCFVYYENGQIYRTPSGESVVLEPGKAVVFLPDGGVEYLEDEYAQYVFAQQYDRYDVEDSDDSE